MPATAKAVAGPARRARAVSAASPRHRDRPDRMATVRSDRRHQRAAVSRRCRLTMALANIAAMLAPGGVFLHNEAAAADAGAQCRWTGLPVKHARTAAIATVRGAPPLADAVWVQEKTLGERAVLRFDVRQVRRGAIRGFGGSKSSNSRRASNVSGGTVEPSNRGTSTGRTPEPDRTRRTSNPSTDSLTLAASPTAPRNLPAAVPRTSSAGRRPDDGSETRQACSAWRPNAMVRSESGP